MLEITTGVAFLMSSLYGARQGASHIATIAGTIKNEIVVEERSFTDTEVMQEYLRQEFFEAPILIEVARCESEFRQFDKDGNVIRGRAVPDDIGVMQINEYFHGETAEKMGLDIHTVEGNVAYAKYLYDKYGLKPWSASKPCWSKSADLAKI